MSLVSFKRQEKTSGEENLHIPQRFVDEVAIHVLGNVLELDNFPLMLGIHGPSGSGKSFQCNILLRSWNLHVQRISGSQLESPLAGGPSQVLKDAYKKAGVKAREERTIGCIVIEDIDAGIGNYGQDVTYTVNRQNVNAALMNLCDEPRKIDGEEVRRCPIIVTANYLDTLYGPLIRHQRMTKFYWKASESEMLEIITGLYKDILGPNDAHLFVEKYPDANVAFFSHVRSLFQSKILHEVTQRRNKAELIEELVINPVQKQHLMTELKNRQRTDALIKLMQIAQDIEQESGKVVGIVE